MNRKLFSIKFYRNFWDFLTKKSDFGIFMDTHHLTVQKHQYNICAFPFLQRQHIKKN